MMKKLTRAALLAAAAFLLAGVTACEHDNGSNDPTLSKIEIKVDESTVKTTYTVGEEFNRAGITVVATYSDGSTKDVTDKATLTATYNDEAFTTSTAGTYEVTLTATYGDKTASATRTITVEADSGKEDEKGEGTGGGTTGGGTTGGDNTGGTTGDDTGNEGGSGNTGGDSGNTGGDTDNDDEQGDTGQGSDEETPDAFESWELDFSSDELKPAKNSSLTEGQVIGNVLTVDATGKGNLNADGYIKVGVGGILSFDVKADATFTFTFNNSNSARTVTFKTDSAVVDTIPADKAEHTVQLKKGLCTIEFAGGDIQISKMSLTYTN